MVCADKLHRQFSNLTTLDVSHWFLPDRPSELLEFIKPNAPFKKSNGWRNNTNLYRPHMPKGHILFMDLDIFLLKNFDEEISQMTKRNESMCCVSATIEWMGEKFNSSLMSLMFFESGVHSKIYEYFEQNESALNNLEGCDQVKTDPQLGSIYYIDDDFPNLKRNLRLHLAHRVSRKLKLPTNICGSITPINLC